MPSAAPPKSKPAAIIPSSRSESTTPPFLAAYHLALDGSEKAIAWVVNSRESPATPCRAVPRGQGAYHAAAVMTSGCMAALLATATDAMGLAGVPEEQRWPLLWPLAAGTANLADGDFAASLTGPVAAETPPRVAATEALAQLPVAATLYRAGSSRTSLRVKAELSSGRKAS